MFFDPAACYALLAHHYDSRLNAITAPFKRDMDFHLRHTKGVLSLCREISAALSLEQRPIDMDLLTAAALLHDAAKYDDPKNHHKDAGRVIAENLDSLGWSTDGVRLSALNSVIKAHKGSFKPLPDYACEAAILRMADKIDMLRRGKDKEDKYDEGIEKIQEYFSKRFPDGSGEQQFLSDFLDAVETLSKDFR